MANQMDDQSVWDLFFAAVMCGFIAGHYTGDDLEGVAALRATDMMLEREKQIARWGAWKSETGG
jgi:hypothetical protein